MTVANAHRAIELVQQRGTGRVVVSFVKQDLNKDEAGEFEEYWRDAGADFVVTHMIWPKQATDVGAADRNK